jgi:hypothetical protein
MKAAFVEAVEREFVFLTDGRAPSVPWLGFLHTVNALVIYAAVAFVAHRAWTVYRTSGTARTPAPS